MAFLGGLELVFASTVLLLRILLISLIITAVIFENQHRSRLPISESPKTKISVSRNVPYSPPTLIHVYQLLLKSSFLILHI